MLLAAQLPTVVVAEPLWRGRSRAAPLGQVSAQREDHDDFLNSYKQTDRRLGAQELSGASSRVQRPYQPFRCATHDPAREACDWPGPAPQQLQMPKQNGGSRNQ